MAPAVYAKSRHAPVRVPTLSLAPPPWARYAARARWLVYHSVWTAISTVSVRLHGAPWGNILGWKKHGRALIKNVVCLKLFDCLFFNSVFANPGNIRSTADGVGKNSTGLPFLYIPTPDPTAIDVQQDANVTLSFTEAALGERIVNGSQICGGMDAEDPTCGRIHLSGRLVALSTKSDISRAEASLAVRHPNAPWLAQGGAHTGGDYYTLELSNIVFLDMYGGPAKLSVREYLDEPPPSIAL